jgi:hypothetical protein
MMVVCLPVCSNNVHGKDSTGNHSPALGIRPGVFTDLAALIIIMTATRSGNQSWAPS